MVKLFSFLASHLSMHDLRQVLTATCFLLLQLLFPSTKIYCQAGYTPPAYYTPPTPAATQFEKYINYPVDHSTGAASVQVPLYNLKAGSIDVPISLSYHTSGVKPGDPSIPVGLGWVLNPGARVTRKILSYPDERAPKAPYQASYDQLQDLQAIQNMEYSPSAPWPTSNRNAILDSESDIFTYYTPTGTQGRFIIQGQGTDFTAIPLLLSKDSIKIHANTYGIDYIEIIDANGTLYRFGSGLTTYSSDTNSITRELDLHPTPQLRTIGWMLTDIISADKADTISFIWKSLQNGGISNAYKKYTPTDNIIITDKLDRNLNLSYPPAQEEIGYFDDDFGGPTVSQVEFMMTAISGIKYKNQEVRMNYTSSFSTILTKIEIYSSNIKQRQVDFHTSSFATPYVRLDSVSFKGLDNQVVNRYRFGYNEFTQLPDEFSRAIDFWGYYNGYTGNSTTVPNFSYQVERYYPQDTYILENLGNRSSNSNATAYILNSVTYPTGGKTTYEYEVNQMYDATLSQAVYSGGVRVKKIQHWSATGQIAETRTYEYGIDNCGYGDGVKMTASMFVDESKTCAWWDPLGYSEAYGVGRMSILKDGVFRKRFISGSPVNPMFMHDLAPVYYRQVTEYIGDATGVNSGKVIYRYSPAPLPVNSSYFLYSNYTYVDNYFQKPALLSTSYFENNGGNYALIQKDSTEYIDYVADTVKNWVVRRYAYIMSNAPTSPIYYETNWNIYFGDWIPGPFQLFPVYLLRGIRVPTSQRSTVYTNSGASSTTEKNYGYANNDYLYPVSLASTNSNGVSTVTHFKYPKDYTVGSSPSNTVAQGIKLLMDRNVVAPVIEEYTEVQPANKIKSGKFTTYKTDKPFPDQMFTLTPGGTASSYTPATITSSSHTKSSSYYLNTTINAYDSYGNVQQATDEIGGLVSSMLYSSDGQHVFAQATNASANEIFFESFEDEGTWASLSGRDQSRVHTGKYSGRITNTSSGEYFCHSNKWLTINSGTARKFRYSGWVYSNGPSVELFLFMKRAGEPGYYSYYDVVSTNITGKWVYLEKEYTVPSDVSSLNMRIDNNGPGTVWFDDIRLHPSNAMMTSYTHDPVAGVTSVSDINSKPTYYEYDAFNRLTLLRDDQGNILKKICYNYAGQPEDCGTYYTSVAKSGNFTKNDCTSGATGQTLTYTVPAGSYSSSISQADADAKAQNDVNANGQAYANANGTCAWYSAAVSGNYYKSNCPSGYTANAYYVSIAAGTYSSAVSQAAANTLATNAAQAQADASGTCTAPTTYVYINNNTGNTYYVTFWNNSTGQNYNYTVYPWSTPAANIPIATYTVTVSDNGSGSSALIDVMGYSTYGMFQYVSNLSVGSGSNNIYMVY